MLKVITYGTFDLLHQGHINLLRRAKALGDYLIVGVTTENYDKNRGKLNVRKSLMERIEDVKRTGYADEIIIEEYEGQKIDDILKYDINIFAIGSDWLGKFDYLMEYCKVIYLERTKGISSTQLRLGDQKIIEIGIIGSGRIANRFVQESKYVSGIDVKGVFNPNIESARKFSDNNELGFYADKLDELMRQVDAVYIATPHLLHAFYIREALLAGKHVLCEKPLVLDSLEAQNLYSLANSKGLILKEAIKTAFCPGFQHLYTIVKSGAIGIVKDIEASFTKLVYGEVRELDPKQAGGSITELASYTLLPIVKILGSNFKDINFYTFKKNDVDLFTRGIITYDNSIATFKVGLGVKTEGHLIISGTKGYVYVPAPWWKTEYFELRYEDQNLSRKFFYKFEGDGLRYEINDFLHSINFPEMRSHYLSREESITILRIIELFLNNKNVHYIK
ncbi:MULTISPECIES: Gfo/Idh/MocA family oxidoreductase [Butyricimonas]|uniref:Gfo/Idh/MocA family oxidoreductase n=1 Tax=Butyricimonas TaxID=574697 RepID=UPI0022E3F122|nr:MULTISPECIES: Gfo/Idh/MocA family oxidoreductase [Butyricimonas]